MWSDRLRRAAALAGGLLLLQLSPWADPAWAAGRKVATVNVDKKRKTTSVKRGTVHQASAKKGKKKGAVYRVPPLLAPAVGLADMQEAEQVGLHGSASFYGHGFQGRRSADGQRYDVRAFTAASNNFPLGSWVAVRRLDSERCAIVKITDRMHARHRRRIIDVSRAVADYFDMIRAGVVMVRVVPLTARAAAHDTCRAAFEVDDACPSCPRWPAATAGRDFYPVNPD